ncbi:ATPase histidine kinase DNA gyrase B HSP90 domain protein [Liquorilactobacillus capillatus DSM 19910]|uniref:histidine kinase n=2 Tax=Liquorilactobacillus capillatus TaxID=480931 RepID=A0A0R1MA90_9LACO|nr:ATPase histidine kinase DNA gyrase B HSP90 domain protein [Liquorilactobacillus capillatus DSM 19910]
MLIADLIRFTLIPFILFLIYRVYHKQKLLANLKKACTQGQVLTINDPHGLIEKAFSNAFNQVQQQRLQVENGVQEQFKQHRDYLIMWSHEVKTPLTALSLLAENENEVASIDVQQQVALAYHQLDLILTYERLADFNHDLVFEWCTVDELLNVIIKKYAVFFIKKQITPQLDITNDAILTDTKWIAVILEQLLMNALKYSKTQTTITIKWRDNKIIISDTGIGIDTSDLPRVFEPGFTGENGRQHGSATGMGLYISRRISNLLGLKLVLKSQLKQGTSAILQFPREKVRHC